jgi:hypothetical protein
MLQTNKNNFKFQPLMVLLQNMFSVQTLENLLSIQHGSIFSIILNKKLPMFHCYLTILLSIKLTSLYEN